jgi:transcriptional regulator with XRE-family HTH domain
MKFHEKFKALAAHQRLSQADIRRGLAQPVASATIHNWVSGRHVPTVDHAFDIARMLGVPLSLLADDAVDVAACLAHLRGDGLTDPAERIVRDLATLHGWRALLDRLTGMTQAQLTAPAAPDAAEATKDPVSDEAVTEGPKPRRAKR